MDGTLGGPQVSKLVDLTYSDARLNFIDDPSNLKNDKVFVFSGRFRSTLCMFTCTASFVFAFAGLFTFLFGRAHTHTYVGILQSERWYLTFSSLLLSTTPICRSLRHGDHLRGGAFPASLLLLLHGCIAHRNVLRCQRRALHAHTQLRRGLPSIKQPLSGQLQLRRRGNSAQGTLRHAE